MKPTSSIRCLLSAVVTGLLLFASGCNTLSINSKKYVGGSHYAATNPVAIAILHRPPSRPYVRLGEIVAEPSSKSVKMEQIEAALQKAAAKMGANAVVIVHDGTQVTGVLIYGPWYRRSLETIQGRVIVGVAIRYTDVAFRGSRPRAGDATSRQQAFTP